jgi:hypothetical protein
MAASNGSTIPAVDLAPFFLDDGGVAPARARATEAVREACMSSGFFRVVNHGVPRELMARALELQALFFALPDEEKAKVRPTEGTSPPFPAGHARQPTLSVDKNELLIVLHPKLWLNLYPAEPAGFRSAFAVCCQCLEFRLIMLPPSSTPSSLLNCLVVLSISVLFSTDMVVQSTCSLRADPRRTPTEPTTCTGHRVQIHRASLTDY